MPLSASTVSADVGASVKNTQHKPTAGVLPRKNLIIGTYDPAITTIADNIPALVLSPEEVGSIYGRGFMLHRLSTQNFEGSGGGETWVIPQAEVAGSQATGTITYVGAATANGTIPLYVAGISVPVTVTSGDAVADMATATAAAITANADLPVTATAALGVVTVVSKSTGLWGNFISLTFGWGLKEVLPAGVSEAVVDMAGGTGTPVIADALDSLGTDDDANENHFTDMVHGYLQDTTTLDAVSNYVGAGNTPVGLYSKTVARPFRSLIGDTVADSAGLAALIVLADLRKTDRATGVIAAPGSPNHPAEIAALAAGIASKLNNNRAEEGMIGQILPGILTGAVADRWTKAQSNRNTAVQNGIGTTKANGGALYAQDVLTFYRPDSVPATSNGYKRYRNISIIQNMLSSTVSNFEQDKWLGISIVDDVAKVANIVDRQKARDEEAVKDDLVALVTAWRDQAWLFEIDTFTLPNIQVQIRAGTNGFDTIVPVIISGEGGIIDTSVEFDAAITILL